MKQKRLENYYLKLMSTLILLTFLVSFVQALPFIPVQQSPENNSTTVAICDEQLTICMDNYNSLYYDFRNGTNCNSNTFNQLKKKNLQLSQDTEIYKAEADNLRVYKTSFYVITVLLVIWIIIFFVNTISKNKFGRLTNNGRKTGSKTRS